MKKFVYHGNPKALSKVLEEECSQNYSSIQKLLRKRDVKINGVRVSGECTVADGMEIEAYFPERDLLKDRVVYYDDRVIVLDKPSALDTYEAAELLSKRFSSVEPVHRLDRNTTGLIIFARDEKAELLLKKAFKEGNTEKTYYATVLRSPLVKEAVLVGYLKKDAERAFVRIRTKPTEGFVRIETAYRVLQVFEDGTAQLEVKIKTGKTHQIRAHLASINCPIVGDDKYGDAAFNRKCKKHRQELRCVELIVCAEGALSYLSRMPFRLV